MTRPRPFSNLGSAELVKALFDSAIASDAARFEDLLFELQGGEDDYAGRKSLGFIKSVLVDVAQRVFGMDT
jgi:hypothetical protein